MNLLAIDARGGGQRELPDAEITAAGTDSAATGAMLKVGAEVLVIGALRLLFWRKDGTEAVF